MKGRDVAYQAPMRAFLPMLLALSAASPFQPVMDTVKATLRDPDSAKFRDIKQTGPDSFCGWVNARNGLGGYTGFELFYDAGGKVEVISQDYLRTMELVEENHPDTSASELQRIAPCRT